jgi:hypothetical protein
MPPKKASVTGATAL